MHAWTPDKEECEAPKPAVHLRRASGGSPGTAGGHAGLAQTCRLWEGELAIWQLSWQTARWRSAILPPSAAAVLRQALPLWRCMLLDLQQPPEQHKSGSGSSCLHTPQHPAFIRLYLHLQNDCCWRTGISLIFCPVVIF